MVVKKLREVLPGACTVLIDQHDHHTVIPKLRLRRVQWDIESARLHETASHIVEVPIAAD